jgi:hypothetical protein
MKSHGESQPILTAILSATNGATSSNRTSKPLQNSQHFTSNKVHPTLNHISIQETDYKCSNVTFDPAYGLETITPNSSDSNSNKHWPLLDDADDLDSLQESSITNVDLAKWEEITQDSLDDITPVPVTNTGQTGQLSRHPPIINPPLVFHQTYTDHAKTPQTLGQNKTNQVDHQSGTSLLDPKIIKVGETKRAHKMSLKKVPPPAPTQVLPNKTGERKPTQTLLHTTGPGFTNQDLRKIFDMMKKLDTDNPVISTPPEMALMVAQQRQQCLQTINVAMANLNTEEAGMIYALYHSYPFPEYHQNPIVSDIPEDTTDSSCESKIFTCMF